MENLMDLTSVREASHVSRSIMMERQRADKSKEKRRKSSVEVPIRPRPVKRDTEDMFRVLKGRANSVQRKTKVFLLICVLFCMLLLLMLPIMAFLNPSDSEVGNGSVTTDPAGGDALLAGIDIA